MTAFSSSGALVAPDLALIAAMVSLVLLFLAGPDALFRDADTGWHIRTGERILDTGSLPKADPYSFSKAGQPWGAWEWGAEIAMGLAHRAAGLPGVAWLFSITLAATVWLWVRLNRVAGGNFLLAALFAAPLLTTLSLHSLARPHLFGWLFLLLTVYFCESWTGSHKRVAIALAFAAGMIWANVHGSFILFPLILAMYGPRLFPMALFAAAGTLVNPVGWHLHQHVISYLMNTELLSRIGEFQRFRFESEGSIQIAIGLTIAVAGGMASLLVGRTSRFLLAALVSAAAFRSARMLPVAALLLLPLANGSLTQLIPQLRSRYFQRLREMDSRLRGFALAPIAALMLFFAIRATHPGFPPEQFPVAAASRIAQLPTEARIFSSDKFGGYLIYRFAGSRKVFFDGRSDFYGVDFLKSYARISGLHTGWRTSFDGWHFTHALLPPDSPLGAELESTGWNALYRDKTSVLLEEAHT